MALSLVPYFEACEGGNRMHGPPLAYPSCAPTRFGSLTLWAGTSNAEESDFSGRLRFRAVTGNPGGEDLAWTARIEGIRCNDVEAAGAPCAQGPDFESTIGGAYQGELGVLLVLRLTDHFSGPGRNESATLQSEVNVFFEIPCNGPDGGAGGTCEVSSSLEAVIPGAVPPRTRAVHEFRGIEINDGGTDGDPSTFDDNFPFLRQGIFIP